MKKIILTAAITLTAFAGAFAQDNGPKTATADLSVTLNRLQSIYVANPTVSLNYANEKDYDEGVSSPQDNHLKIYSTGAFEVKVVATDLSATGTDQKIAASTITIKADMASLNPLDNMADNDDPMPLPTGTAKTLFTSTTGGVNRNVKVTYAGQGGNEYVNKFFKGAGETQNKYSTTVTYSIEAK